ncbi:MAG: ABC transporter ATP-binding protein [Candidatus Peribacteraceae bacterium]
MPAQKPVITVSHLNVTYFPGTSYEVRALKDINLEIEPGEFIIFFGPSGCGKSTLLYSISGLERKISGDIIVKNQNLRTLSGKEREAFHQKTIGMIFQAYYLIPSLSVIQNVTLPQMALNVGIGEREEHGLKLLKQFGVFEQARKLPLELSGGQQQRVAICRSVMNDPDIILADEPVGNLDSKSSEEVMLLLRKLNDDLKKTVVLVTHDPSHIHHAHRVFYLRDGQVIRVQKNTEEERKQSPVITAAKSSLNINLDEWAKTLSPEALASPDALAELVRSQELLTEVLTGMTRRDIFAMAQIMQGMLAGRRTGGKLRRLLRDAGLDPVRSRKVLTEIQTFVREVRKLRKVGKKRGLVHFDPLFREAQEIRRFLQARQHVHIRDARHALSIEQLLYERLRRSIDRRGLRDALMKPLAKGGADMHGEEADRFVRALEELLLARGEAQARKPEEMSETPTEDLKKLHWTMRALSVLPEYLKLFRPRKP